MLTNGYNYGKGMSLTEAFVVLGLIARKVGVSTNAQEGFLLYANYLRP